MAGSAGLIGRPEQERRYETAAPAGAQRTSMDVHLVERARGGSRAAFGRLWERWAPTLHGILLSMSRDQDVPDLMQEVWLKALRSLPNLKDPAAFGGWICTIARNRGRDALKSKRNDTVSLPDEVHAAPESSGEKADLVMNELRSLPEAYRESLTLRLVEGLTGPEISERTGLTPGSVRVNLCRGMKLLRERLQRENLL